MPNVFPAACYRMTALVIFVWIAVAPATGQGFSGIPHDPSRTLSYFEWEMRELSEARSSLADSPEHLSAGPATISADVLRHPLSSKARRRLERALHLSELGKHPAAIEELREALVKEPASAPYAHNLLGIEYVENRQFADARNSFEEAVRLMPHESVTHSNLGYSLAVEGDWKSAEQEARAAIRLDAGNARAKSLLDLVLHIHRTSTH